MDIDRIMTWSDTKTGYRQVIVFKDGTERTTYSDYKLSLDIPYFELVSGS